MKHTSYQHYVEDIVSLVPSEMDEQFKSILKENLLPLAEKAWIDFLMEDRETYHLFDDELEQAWEKSSEDQIQESLNKLSDLDLISTGINENGEIVYSITTEGEKYLKNNNRFI